MSAADAHRAILAVWRIEQPRLITSLARMLLDVPLAEDLTQDALLAAFETWPVTGIPERPGAWLLATARRRAVDHLRRAISLLHVSNFNRGHRSPYFVPKRWRIGQVG